MSRWDGGHATGTGRAVRAAAAVMFLLQTLFPQAFFAQAPAAMPLRLAFSGATLEIVLSDYAEKTGRTLIQAPNLPKATVTLRSQTDLTLDEYLQAIETVLSMHGIAVLKEGEKFAKVVPNQEARREAMPILEQVGDDPLPEGSLMVSQMIPLKHIDLAEAKKAIEPLQHSFAVVHTLERNNSLLVTDTASNVNRIVQVLHLLDQPVEAREEPNVIQIKFAKSAEIKRKLEEIIAEAQKEVQESTVPQQRMAGPPGVVVTPPSIPGVIRARRPAPAQADIAPELIAEAERGIIRGRVQIIADDRTNILIIITRPENMSFFNRIIDVLDVETAPDVIVRVFRLEFAISEDVAVMLNELIGATSAGEERVRPPVPGDAGDAEARSIALREYAARRQAEAAAEPGKSKVGELSKENIKILADKRTNSLVIMASRGDMATLQEIVRDMDMMLSQVLIETVIIEVQLGDELQTGVDWVQRSMVAYNQRSDGSRSPIAAFTGGGGGGTLTPVDATTQVSIPRAGGLTYYLTLFDLNLDAVFQMVSRDDRSRVLSSPVILTTDNTEATISSTEKIYIFRGTRYDERGNPYADFTTEPVGLTLKVKPQINKNGIVMMTISQNMSEPGQVGEPTSGATVSSERNFEAAIAVQDRQTIVLGGLVRESRSSARTKIPLLGDIPLLGRLFSSNVDGTARRETIVFITPYIVNTPEQIAAETIRRKEALDGPRDWQRGWSDSQIAKPSDEEIREQREWERERLRLRRERDLAERQRRRAERAAKAFRGGVASDDARVPDREADLPLDRYDDVLENIDAGIEAEVRGGADR